MKFPCRFFQHSAFLLICGFLSLSVSAFDEYLVIDVSAGQSTNSYPVLYYNEGALLGSVTDDTYKTDKILLKKITAGTFMMGSPVNEVGRPSVNPNEDLHQVTLTQDFYLGVYETTEYQLNKTSDLDGTAKTPAKSKDYQTIIINQFVNPLNTKAELDNLIVSIPTEAQWEYACRAGTNTAYSFGNDAGQLGNYAWYEANSGIIIKFPGEVGTKLPNAWGFYDMHGNVAEFCRDEYTIHLGTNAVIDPEEKDGISDRVAKNGAYDEDASKCRCAYRYGIGNGGSYQIGFRICISIPPPPPTYDLTVVNGSGDGSYTNGYIQQIIADAPPAWYEFDVWTGDTNDIDDVSAATTTVAIAASSITVTAAYKQLTYDITVSNGTASAYTATNGQVVVIIADPPATETNVFYRWEGDVATVADISAMTTTVTIAGADVDLTAVYRDAPYLLTVNGGTGDGYHFEGEVVTISASAPDASHTFWWTGYTSTVADPEAWNTTLVMPGNDIGITATYPDIKYTLTVVNGNGSGSYTDGTQVNVSPNSPPSDIHEFDQWAGDTNGLDSASSGSAVFTVDGADALIEPHYKPLSAVEGVYMIVDLSGDFDITYTNAFPSGGWGDTYKDDKMAFRRIMPGTYQMGVGDDLNEDVHDVTLTESFYIGVFEVTQGQWNNVVGGYPSSYTGSGREYYPVENISYQDIRGVDNALSWPANSDVDASSFVGIMRLKASSDAFDLPTEAQWEYACRAGTTGNYYVADSDIFDAAVISNVYQTSVTTSAQAGTKVPNDWGLHDMHGNVYEWCLDWFYGSGLGTDAQVDPVGPDAPSTTYYNWHKRVIRGGAFNLTAHPCSKAGFRAGNEDNKKLDFKEVANIGFRMTMAAGVPHTLTIVDSKNDNSGTFHYRAKVAISAKEPTVQGQIFDYWKVEPEGAFAGPLFNAEERDTIISMPRQTITVSAQYK